MLNNRKAAPWIVTITLILQATGLNVSANSEPVPFPDIMFDQYEIATEPAKHQTVLTGNFLEGPRAQLAVVSVDHSGGRGLRIFTFEDETWKTSVDATLNPGTMVVDVAKIGAVDRLLTFSPSGVKWFDPESSTERTLLEAAFNFYPPDDGHVPQLGFARDLTGDGRDDIVIPGFDGFWISTQSNDGSFADGVKLGPREPYLGSTAPGEKRTYRERGVNALTAPWYLSRIHQLDYNGDGRIDLAFWNEDHFDVYLQEDSGHFSAEPVPFRTSVSFDFDGAYASGFERSDKSAFALFTGMTKKSTHTMLYSLRDINGDGIADLVTLTLTGRSILRQRSSYNVHFGRRTSEGVSFPSNPDTVIRPRNHAGGMLPWGYSSQWFQDLDGDGNQEAMFTQVKMGPTGMTRALAAGSIALDLEIFRMEGGLFGERSTAKFKIRPRLHRIGKAPFFPPVVTGDINGDGLSDLVVGHDWDELRIYPGESGPNLFARQPQNISVDLPGDPANFRSVDLNGKGKLDIVIHHPSPTDPHRIITLMSR
jgi:hypothetical protein